ncbi:MAG TPA: serine hydrolase domain-containing protein [Saprospiraceae bacterium]|nr:serine hydrolase domain-containing protein [Saprospiraceae bacterium]
MTIYNNFVLKLACLFLFLSLKPAFLFSQFLKKDLEFQISEIIKFDTSIEPEKTPGMEIAVIDRDSVWYITVGSKYKDKEEILKSNDVFEIGSVTKVLTSTLVDILAEKNIISRDSTINSYLPEEYRNPRMSQYLIKDLLNHSTQLPKRPLYFGRYEKDPQNPYEYYGDKELLEFYRDYIPDNEEFFVYSHTNYALLSYILERLLNADFGDIMEKYLFDPLDMHQSFVEFKERKKEVITIGYDRALKEVKPWIFNSFKGSESVKSTCEDLVKFIKANFDDYNTDLGVYMKDNFEQRNISFNDKLFISDGWNLLEVNDLIVATHTGKTSGHSAFIGFVRSTKTGVIVLSNSAFGSQDLGMLILRMINFNWKRNQ